MDFAAAMDLSEPCVVRLVPRSRLRRRTRRQHRPVRDPAAALAPPTSRSPTSMRRPRTPGSLAPECCSSLTRTRHRARAGKTRRARYEQTEAVELLIAFLGPSARGSARDDAGRSKRCAPRRRGAEPARRTRRPRLRARGRRATVSILAEDDRMVRASPPDELVVGPPSVCLRTPSAGGRGQLPTARSPSARNSASADSPFRGRRVLRAQHRFDLRELHVAVGDDVEAVTPRVADVIAADACAGLAGGGEHGASRRPRRVRSGGARAAARPSARRAR